MTLESSLFSGNMKIGVRAKLLARGEESFPKLEKAIEKYYTRQLPDEAGTKLLINSGLSKQEAQEIFLRSKHKIPQNIRPTYIRGIPARVDTKNGFPSGIIYEEQPFSIQTFLENINFGYNMPEDVVEQIKKIGNLFEDTRKVAKQTIDNIEKELEKKSFDVIDLQLESLRVFIAKHFLEINVPPKKIRIQKQPILPKSAKITKDTTEYDSRYIITPTTMIYQPLAQTKDILIMNGGDPITKIAVDIGFSGKLSMKNRIPFTTLSFKELPKQLFEDTLERVIECLERYIRYEEDNPDSQWNESYSPIAVQDPLYIEFFNNVASRKNWKEFNNLTKHGEHVAESLKQKNYSDPVKVSITINYIRGNDLVFPTPKHYYTFMKHIPKEIQEKVFTKMQAIYASQLTLPTKQSLSRKKKKMLQDITVEDKQDEYIARKLIATIDSEIEKASKIKKIFSKDYSSKMYLRYVYAKADTPRLPKWSMLKVDAYKKSLSTVTEASPNIKSFKIRV